MTTGAQGKPHVAVVIPVRVPAPWLGEAISSVLGQSAPVAEVVVVDDGSEGDAVARTVEAVGDERVRYLRQEHGGVAQARNVGVAQTTGEWICFLDADDVWLADKLRQQLDTVGRHPGTGVVVTSYAIADEHLRRRGTVTVTDKTLRRWVLGDGPGMGFGSTAMVRRSVFEALGGFDEALAVSADQDFALRAAARSPVEIIREPLVVYRTHRRQMHSRIDQLRRDKAVVLPRHLEGRDLKRAVANLAYRSAWSALRHRDLKGTCRALARVVRNRPLALFGLPVRVAVGRLRRRVLPLGRPHTPAVDHQVVAVDEASLVGGEIDRGAGDVVHET